MARLKDVLLALREPARAARRDRLMRVSTRLFARALAVVRDEASVVHAIVDEARRRDAGLVVVGTSKRSWWERALLGGVAEQVINCAHRSVLVTPLANPTEIGTKNPIEWTKCPRAAAPASNHGRADLHRRLPGFAFSPDSNDLDRWR